MLAVGDECWKPHPLTTMFRSNQHAALATSLSNDFASGVHFHATGTGKSWIALQLLLEFEKHQKRHHALQRSPQPSNIFWICEQKSILVEQFAKETLKARGFADVYKTFLLLDYSVSKPADWVQQVNAATVWRKPLLVIINRAFLTSSTRYESLRLPIHLLIHDECHSITNQTTRAFYAWLRQRPGDPTRCIGFSATPVLTESPYTQILSAYTIQDACRDGTIVPPRIVWLKREEGYVGDDDVRRVLIKALPYLPYKKILVWCGMIETAHRLAASWATDPAFACWLFAVDTTGSSGTSTATPKPSYDAFHALEERGFLFCASKHREGSDIPRLDACVFLDRVANRNAKTFLQCTGRVLRQDPAGRKTHGLILDVSAASAMKVCDRIHQYIDPFRKSEGAFPFRYAFRRDGDNNEIQIHMLEMTAKPKPPTPPTSSLIKPLSSHIDSLFVRTLPADPRYAERLRLEMDLLAAKDLFGYIQQALEILAITKDIPHVTRGSCGSSLVCYMLGISHVDPIRWNIRFARFLNEFRDTLPDIDFDFPHIHRDEVFLQIHMRWPGRVARISNHVFYHAKSAVREALRHVGIRKQIPALQITQTIRRLPQVQQRAVHTRTKELENTFKGYSLHCGGIVFYPDGVPAALTLASKRGTLSQVTLNKQDVAKEARFKIDILSSRALSQLMDARRYAGLTGPIDFEAFVTDPPTAELFRKGDNIGITLAESPLIRKAFMKIRPTTLEQVALCLAIIRPAAREARVAETTADLDTMFVYDDDAIALVAAALGCTDAEADRFRRRFAKGDKAVATDIRKALKGNPAGTEIANTVLDQLKNLRQYSFCKSHAFSYAQLVWQLGYMKTHHPAAFWRATLKHNESMYRRWVHLYEARLAGVSPTLAGKGQGPSIYAEARRKKALTGVATQSAADQLRGPLGIWMPPSSDRTSSDRSDETQSGFFPNTYMIPEGKTRARIRGIIAASRVLNWAGPVKRAVLFVGTGPQTYQELIVSGPSLFLAKKIGVTCDAERVEEGVWSTEKATFW